MITVTFLLDRFYVKPKPEMKLKMFYKWTSKIYRVPQDIFLTVLFLHNIDLFCFISNLQICYLDIFWINLIKKKHQLKHWSNLNQTWLRKKGGISNLELSARSPLKLEKIWFFYVKWWFFTRNTPTIFAPPSARRNFLKCAPLTIYRFVRRRQSWDWAVTIDLLHISVWF
jgi:hypothetical protein